MKNDRKKNKLFSENSSDTKKQKRRNFSDFVEENNNSNIAEENENLKEIMKLSERSFSEWNNEKDDIFNSL